MKICFIPSTYCYDFYNDLNNDAHIKQNYSTNFNENEKKGGIFTSNNALKAIIQLIKQF